MPSVSQRKYGIASGAGKVRHLECSLCTGRGWLVDETFTCPTCCGSKQITALLRDADGNVIPRYPPVGDLVRGSIAAACVATGFYAIVWVAFAVWG